MPRPIATIFVTIALAIAASATSPNYAKLMLGAWLCRIPGKTDRIVIFHSDGSWGVPFSILSRREDWQHEDTRGRRWRVEGDKLMMRTASADGGRPPEERIVSFGETAFETEVNGIRISYTRTKLWPRKSPNQTMKPTRPLQENPSEFATTPSRGLSLSR